MRTRWMLPLAILLLTAFLTMGIAAAGERPDTALADSFEEEETVSASSESLFGFLLTLSPISSEMLAEDELGAGIDNRPDH